MPVIIPPSYLCSHFALLSNYCIHFALYITIETRELSVKFVQYESRIEASHCEKVSANVQCAKVCANVQCAKVCAACHNEEGVITTYATIRYADHIHELIIARDGHNDRLHSFAASSVAVFLCDRFAP